MKQWEEERYRAREEEYKLTQEQVDILNQQTVSEVTAESDGTKVEQVWNCNTGKYEPVIVNPDIPHLPHPSTEEYIIQEALFIRKMIMYESPQYYTNLLHRINIKRGLGILPSFL